MLFPITTVVLGACLYWAYTRAGRRSALFIGLCVWGFGVLLMSSPIFTYDVAYSIIADVFVAGCLLALTLSYLIIRRPAHEAPPCYWNRAREVSVARALGGVGIFGCTILLLDSGVTITASYLLENLGAIRAANFESLDDPGSGSAVALVGTFCAAGSVLSVITAAHYGRDERLLLSLGVTNFFLIGAVGLFAYGGRTTLFYAISLALISVALGHRRVFALSPRTLVLAAALLVSVWYFAVSWVQTREGSVDPEAIMIDTQRADYSAWLAPIARSDDALGIGLLSLGYMASPLPSLAYYIQRDPIPGPFWGRYEYPLPTLVVSKLVGESPRPWNAVRREVFSPFETAGYFGNVWATWLRDLLVDFGYAGALTFCALFGAFMAWARNAYERTRALHYHWLEVLACFTFAYGAFAGILFFTFLATSFFLAVGMMIAIRLVIASPPTRLPVNR